MNLPPSHTADVLIIGAGIAGLEAAKEIRSSGRQVIVLEKSRGLGGRAATRRWDGLPVDHGAQFFTTRSNAFKKQVADWLARGICHEWTRGFHQYSDNSLHEPQADAFPRYACREGMSFLGRDLAGEESDFVHRQTKVTALCVEDGHWKATTEGGSFYFSKGLVITAPPAQSAALLAEAVPETAQQLNRLAMTPCLALAVRYPRRDIPWRGVKCHNHPVLSWVGNDTSKRPDLHPLSTILVLHASPEFSVQNCPSDEVTMTQTLLEAAADVTGENFASPTSFFLQRWRYAQAPDSASITREALIIDAPAPLVVAGDSIAGGKIEGAWLSGLAAAQHLKTCAV